MASLDSLKKSRMGWFLFSLSLFCVFQTAACRQILKAGCIACRVRQDRTSSRSCACTTCLLIRTLVRCSCLGRFRASFPSPLHTFILILILPSLWLAPFPLPLLSSLSIDPASINTRVGGGVAPHRDLPADFRDFFFCIFFQGTFLCCDSPQKFSCRAIKGASDLDPPHRTEQADAASSPGTQAFRTASSHPSSRDVSSRRVEGGGICQCTEQADAASSPGTQAFRTASSHPSSRDVSSRRVEGGGICQSCAERIGVEFWLACPGRERGRGLLRCFGHAATWEPAQKTQFDGPTCSEPGVNGSVAEALRDNQQVEKLTIIGNTWFGDDEAKELGKELAKHPSLKILNLRNFTWAPDSGGRLAIANGIERSTTITRLDLSMEALGDDGETALADALASNSSLVTLSGDISAPGASALARALQRNTALRNLDLGGSDIGDGSTTALADALASNSSLVTLDLYHSSISAPGASALARALRNNATLEDLNLTGNHIGDGGTTALADALESNSSLVHLDLRYCRFSPSGASALARALHNNATLEGLFLTGDDDNEGDSYIGDDGATAFAGALTSNSSLTWLMLDYQGIFDAGASAIARALLQNNTLLKLDLSDNEIGDGGATAVGTALAFNSSLTILELRGCSISDPGSSAIGNNLANNTTLQSLRFDWNRIRDAGVQAFSKVLASNTSLTSLELCDCSIDKQGARILGRAWGTSTNSELEFITDEFILEEAQQVREEILEREKLLAFGMGMHPRLGFPEAHEGDANVESINHRVQPEIFRQIGHLILDMFIREEILLDREKLLAFGMGMHPRLGGQEAHEGDANVGSINHRVQPEIFRQIGHLILDMFDAGH